MLRFAEVFGECEAIVAPSSSCVGTVRELYPAPLGIDDPVTQRVFELSEFLVNELEVEDVGASFAHTVAYTRPATIERAGSKASTGRER